MKTIEFTLDTKSISAAILEFQKYREGIAQKCELLRNMIGEYLRASTELEYEVAVGQVNIQGDDDGKSVTVDVQYGDNETVVIAHGPDVTFLEFGAGVYFNGPAHQSPHPWGDRFGFLIGEYGAQNGQNKTWSYDKGRVVTLGTPASMGMYRSLIELTSSGALDAMVKDVFG